MVFRVAARTLLELGADLISSDAVAIYELVKNGIDARSTDGVTVEFSIALPRRDYTDALTRISELLQRQRQRNVTKDVVTAEMSDIKAFVRERLLASAPKEARARIQRALDDAATPEQMCAQLQQAYALSNSIEFRDTGRGMSRGDLIDAYLVIGTPSRRRAIDDAIALGSEAPFLGEKGIGRLSAMRLGSRVHIETATADDTHLNVLDIDWSSFDDLDKLIDDVAVEPTKGLKKPAGYSGTTIRITDLNGSWSPRAAREIAKDQFARLTDPLAKTKRRFRIVILFNGERIDIPRLDRTILDYAHARVTGTYEIKEGNAQLEADLWCADLGKRNAPETRRIFLEQVDLRSITDDPDTEIPASALRSVGPFTFELYWFNRRLLHGIDAIGDRSRVLELQRQWSGIMLFRDGYRVFPYGDERDDWLGLDRTALGAKGYKLNKLQFIGRVLISRTLNPQLIDQTSREGLTDRPEKFVLIETMQYVIDRLRTFLDEVDARQRHVDIDLEATEKRVEGLEKRARASIRELEKRHRDERPKLQELLEMFAELQIAFARAKARTVEVENERDRMIQLAGIGLMLEVVAHELARSTEYTLRMLDDSLPAQLPADIAPVFRTLRDEMKTMNKRLRVLDPLSVSGRQRKETFGLAALIREIFEGHAAQFRRHHIKTEVRLTTDDKDVRVHGVRGMFVQIVENLIQNSVYWMDLRRADEDDYVPRITITIGAAPTVMEFTDNGPGVQPSLQQEVFRPFFSTKGKTRRQGLGLYIARDCATYHGGQLYLSDERRVHRGRLNTFVLELPSDLVS